MTEAPLAVPTQGPPGSARGPSDPTGRSNPNSNRNGMNAIRVFFIGGYLAYRALFNWIHWSMYIPTMLGGPVFQILFFAYIGRYANLRSDEFFVIGNAVAISSLGGIFGMAMTIGGERWTQTLSSILVTPANRLALFLGRALPNLANGVIVSTVGFAVGWLLLDFSLKPAEIPVIALIVVVTSFSCTAFGTMIGAFGLRGRDIFFFANLMIFVFLLFCGVNVPVDSLPAWMQAVGRVLPLTHGIDAARRIADGTPAGEVSGLVLTEAGIGLCYAALAYTLLRFFEADGRRRATLETM
jgi:ABC-2 type transport system permease protein